MKIRNKKTGEIGELQLTEKHYGVTVGNGTSSCGIELYSSLAELNEEWEDVPEEPKDFWFIDPEILIACESTEPLLCDKKVAIETMKQIGNYFETKEEAEKAVDKLKAWKRLKYKGFKISLKKESNIGYLEANWQVLQGDYSDVDICFGGEE